jgi:hypothetical protein
VTRQRKVAQLRLPTPSSQLAAPVANVQGSGKVPLYSDSFTPSRRAQSYDGADGKMVYER